MLVFLKIFKYAAGIPFGLDLKKYFDPNVHGTTTVCGTLEEWIKEGIRVKNYPVYNNMTFYCNVIGVNGQTDGAYVRLIIDGPPVEMSNTVPSHLHSTEDLHEYFMNRIQSL